MMRQQFPGYYRPSEAEFQQMWQEGIFSFDANVLLNLYRYTAATRDNLLSIIERVAGRIWLTNQAASEFLRNRRTVIDQQHAAYDYIRNSIISNNLTGLAKKAEDRYPKHSGLDFSAIKKIAMEAQSQLEGLLKAAKDNHPQLHNEDQIIDRVTALFAGKVGDAYPSDLLNRLHEESQARYDREQPPGYEDAKTKAGVRQYGDALVWFQLLDYAAQVKKPIIFVTDDRKEDWWDGLRGKTVGPRPELIQEMADLAGVQFYMYQPERFMELADPYLAIPEQPEAIKEVREVGQLFSPVVDDLLGGNLSPGGTPTGVVNRSGFILDVYNDQLDLADRFVRYGRYDRAVALAGETLEAALQVLADRNGIVLPDVHPSLYASVVPAIILNHELLKNGVYSQQFHATVSVAIEQWNLAKHGTGDQLDGENVEMMIQDIRLFIRRQFQVVSIPLLGEIS